MARQIAIIVFCVAAALGIGVVSWRLVVQPKSGKDSSKSPAAAHVDHVVSEENLNQVRLTDESFQRLGLKTGVVEQKMMQRSRIYGCEALVPIGRTAIVASPVAGIVRAPADGMSKVGRKVTRGQTVLQVLPLLTPEARTTMMSSLVDAEGQVNNAKTSLEAAQIAMDRAKRLLKEEAGSQRQVDETQAAYDLAVKTLDAAKARFSILSKVVGEADNGTAAPIAIETPEDGVLRAISALPGQMVPGGGALFEIMDLSKLWVRVPIPVGDLDEMNRDADARIGRLYGSRLDDTRSARPVAAPPSANVLSGTVDFYYEFPNPKGDVTPGQRLAATIPLLDSARSLVAPWSSIVFDMHGGSWVFVELKPLTYVRRRVEVRYVEGRDAVLSSGPPVGALVVSEGAIELFAAETGFIK